MVDGNGGLNYSYRDPCVVRDCHLCVPEKPGWFQQRSSALFAFVVRGLWEATFAPKVFPSSERYTVDQPNN